MNWKILVIASGAMMVASAGGQGAMMATDLRCEYAVNPLGIDVKQPRLSWRLNSSDRDQVQSAYQILAASSAEALQADRGDLWDSGQVQTSQSLHVEYNGAPLKSGQRVWWKVRVWDAQGVASDYSEPAWWEMGMLQPTDWTGKWITRDEPPAASEEELYQEHPVPLLRQEFMAAQKIVRARAYISGLGYYELSINGQRVGDQVLDPGWTTYSKNVLYSTYDVTDLLRDGRNAVGIVLGNGWYNPLPLRMWGSKNPREHLIIGRPRAILQLNLEYADGSRESVVTDESWKVGSGPILKNSIYLGEVYDARREQKGWDQSGFDDAAWKNAVVSTEPMGTLRAQYAPPIRVKETIQPVAVTQPQPGVFIFDMGRNFAGWVTLTVSKAKPGDTIRMRFGELLYPDGTLNVMTSVCGQIKSKGMGGPGAPDVAWQADTYICKGDGQEAYRPRFTFHGFRYVELTGFPSEPTRDALIGHRLYSDVEPVGTFECSNPMLNRIQEMVRSTLLSNLFSVQSDCPHRERFGYGGDIIVSNEMAMLNFDMARFYVKAVLDLQDAARDNGGLTETAPFVGIADDGFGGGSGPIEWGTGHPVLLWNLYQYYGNRRLLEEQYETAQRWVALLESKAKDDVIDVGLSDHEGLVPKPTALTGTAFYWYNAELMTRIARVLGKDADVQHYSDLADRIRKTFNAKFLHAGTGGYDSKTQACQAFALYMNLVPPQEREAAVKVLVEDIAARQQHLSTGIFGTKFMLQALRDANRADVAYAMVNQKTFPGWGHMLEGGATTLWEHWEFSDNTFSHNHPMFGSVSEWFYRSLAGINPHPQAVGFDRVVIRPQVVGDLTWVRATYHSVRGPIVIEWRKDDQTLQLKIVIPANTTATVAVPVSDEAGVFEGDTPIEKAEGVHTVQREAGVWNCTIGSGTYEWRVQSK